MRKLIATFVIALAFIGCSTAKQIECTVVGGADTLLSNAFAAAGQCSNPSAIKADLDSAASKIGLCTQNLKPSGIIADACAQLATSYIASLGGKIPASYGCNPTIALGALQAAATSACNLIPAHPKK